MENKAENTVYHIIKYVGGILDGSTTEIFTENIPFLTCVVNFEAKTAHYYHLVSDKVVDSSDVEFLQTYYSFYISKELTKENEKYLEDHCKGYKETINKYYEENNQKENNK